jgi:hypothetical protein
MTEISSSVATSGAFAHTTLDDPAWVHRQVIVDAKKLTIYVHCSKRINGGGNTYSFENIMDASLWWSLLKDKKTL